jgi:pentatricopeptide repeat domain-containing protein 1
MQDREINPDVMTYNATISACEKGGQWEKALDLFREMQDREIDPSVMTYNAAISACEK